jgi:hypothetical protein
VIANIEFIGAGEKKVTASITIKKKHITIRDS